LSTTNVIDDATRQALLEKGRALAVERGWTWREPVEVKAGFVDGASVWIVRTNTLARGQSANLVFRQSDQSLVSAGYLPR
jgi:hypothetical protein